VGKKHLLVFASAVLSLSASPVHAQESEVSLQDPSYLPAEGHLISDTGISYQRDINRRYAAPNPLYGISGFSFSYSYSNHSYLGSQAVQYGLLDDLVVGLGGSCGYRDETYREEDPFITSGTYDYKDSAHGCEDPYVQVIYRTLHQTDLADFPLNVDLTATYAPNLLKGDFAHIAIAPGANSGDVNVALSRVFEDVTLLGRAGASLVGKAKLTDGAGDSEYNSAVARPYLSVESQYRALDDMFLLGGVRVSPGYRQSQITTYNYTYIYGYIATEKTDVRAGYDVSPYIGAAWTLIPDRLSLSVRYQHSFEGDSHLYNYGALTSEFTDNGSDYIAIDLRVLWF